MITICIATAVSLIREGLLHTLTEERGVLAVATALHGDDVLRSCGAGHPDVLVLDSALPGPATAELLRRLHQRGTDAGIILFGNFTVDTVLPAHRLHTAGLLSWADASEDFVRAVHAAAAGESYVSTRVTSLLTHAAADPAPPTSEVDHLLTPTELQVFRALSRNQTSQEIARSMFISYRTVQKHRSNITRKLHLEGSNALLAFALRYEHRRP
ncbi:MAG: response regulator transcription factor [Bacteroidetes bacterium]|nr:response regulator transcription factor [Bacteroidota bacterium]